MEEKAHQTLSWGDRAKLCLVWFMLGGFVIGIITTIPAAIVGFVAAPFHQFVALSALVVGIGGAVYGRYPPGLS